METNKPLNQNPEESKEIKQEENSNPSTDSTEQKTESTEKPTETMATDPQLETSENQAIEKKKISEKSGEEITIPDTSAEPPEKKSNEEIQDQPVLESTQSEKELVADKSETVEQDAETSKEDVSSPAEASVKDAPIETTKDLLSDESPVTEKPSEELATPEVSKKDSLTETTKDQLSDESPVTEKPTEEIVTPQVSAELPDEKSEEKEAQPIPEPSSSEEEKEAEKSISKKELDTKAVEEVKDESTDLEILDEHDDEEEDEDDHHEEVEEEQINYDEIEIGDLVSLLEEIVEGEEITTLRKKVALIKMAFAKKHKSHLEKHLEAISEHEDEEEGKEPQKDDLGKRFDAAFKVYSIKRKAHLNQQELQKQTNLDTKKLILEELKSLIESEESLKKTYDDFKALQDKWKNVGLVPKAEVNNLWQNYHFYVEKFFDKVKINKELRDLDMKKNMESKIELCEKAEELLLETSILKSFKQLQQYHRQWKEIGPIPQDKKDDLWERFKSTTEKINEGRREHYNKMKADQEVNLVSKAALCEKAEEVLKLENNSIKEWNTNTNQISELLKIWKTIGPAPRKQNDEIWERFKTSLDTFFAGKKEYFQQIKDEQLHNYNLKLDLCAQAEAIKANTDWKNTTRDLINLQKDWKKIGPVPRKHSDKVWHRFRAACDEFFNNKSEYFANLKTHESDNLKVKEELIKKVESFGFGSDKNENLETLKGFQRQWTEIGHVPFKDKDKIQNAFRTAINNKLDQLKISKAEMQTLNYKQRFENIKDKADSGRILRNEKYFLSQKMKKLEEEIQLLENNMGFLAKSKKADLLKLEFTKKIDDARNEVQVLKEKIKFLEREAE